MEEKNQYDKVAAETKSIGFDYQYYFFLLQLLKMGAGEKIGLEVKDDVHIELPNGELILMQLKHTVRTGASGEAVNLTERDKDLWKTLKTWINIITDVTQGRKAESDQITFIDKTTFILVSNKSESNRNKFLTKISELKTDSLSVKDFKSYLTTLLNETEDTPTNKDLREHILLFLGLSNNLLKKFVSKIQFQLEEDDLIAKIKIEIRSFMIPDEKIDDVYNSLNSTLRDNNYIDIKNKAKVVITHDDFLQKYRNCFGKMAKLPIRRVEPVLPDDYYSQHFIKQLIDIEDVDASEKDQIIGYTKLKLLMFNNIQTWLHKGELTGPQKDVFDKICITHWNNEFRAAHQANKKALKNGQTMTEIEGDIVLAANKCLKELRKLILSIEDDALDVDISNGQFYLLADELRMGWHLDWERKYKKI